MISLGLDIGSNSVGSAWVDDETGQVRCGVSVFPAGVDESDKKGRGEPKGRQRRQARQLMRLLRRKAARRRKLIQALIEHKLLPADPDERAALFSKGDPRKGETPWHLRRKGLVEELTSFEFGRVLVHLNQRRGAFGITVEKHEDDEAAEQASRAARRRNGEAGGGSDVDGKVKAGIQQAQKLLAGRTFGQAIADMLDESLARVGQTQRLYPAAPVRNREDSYLHVATREMIRDEFTRLWEKQKSFDGPLARLLTPELRKLLDDTDPADPKVSRIWRHGGIIFGQRRHYWRVGALGRCKLEPSERCCPYYDMYAQHFRVLETVNNIRIQEDGGPWKPLTDEQRDKLIQTLRSQKSASLSTVLRALEIDRASLRRKSIPADRIRINLEADDQREINCDWFHATVVLGAIGEENWRRLPDNQKKGVNRLLLRLDPEDSGSESTLRDAAKKYWHLHDEAADKLVAAWKSRPVTSRRMKLSRTAIINLMPYMNRRVGNRWGEEIRPTVTDARQAFAEDATNNATPEQRARYAFWISPNLRQVLLKRCDGDSAKVAHYLSFRGLNADDRHYLKKHGLIVLPPPPVLANPVARKAVYAVKRHIDAYLAEFGRSPDRIVIEMTRDATKPKKLRDQELNLIRTREKIRKQIIVEHHLENLSASQREKAITRVLLARQQGLHSAYSGETLDEKVAAQGHDAQGNEVEIDHIIPRACGGGDGLNNLVVCYAKENRDKGRRSPRQWLTDDRFARVEQVFAPIVAKDQWNDRTAGGFFTWSDNKAKWDNLHKTPAERDDWQPSQLSDTATAAREIAAYLQAALYPHEAVNEKDTNTRRIFFTKGQYTKRLRDDWGLYHHSGAPDDRPIKDRQDHRHHAVDAAIIAMTSPTVLWQMWKLDCDYERQCWEAKASGRNIQSVPRPKVPVPKPWCNVDALRRAVIEPLYRPISRDLQAIWAVSHAPERRRIAGAFHEATMYGPIRGEKDQFTVRIPVHKLKGAYLRLPQKGRDHPGGNSYLVRDLSLRRYLRSVVSNAGLDPDQLTEKQATQLRLQGRFCWPNGVPIRKVVCRLTLGDSCVRIGPTHDDPLGHTARAYKGGSNHHIEIRQDKNGKWIGQVVSTFEAAQRKRALLECRKRREREVEASGLTGRDLRAALRSARHEAHVSHPIVDRRDNDQGTFIMSLSIGEMLLMRHKDTGEPGVFVVRKLTGDRRIYVSAHTDARSATAEKDAEGRSIAGSERELIELRASSLQTLGVDPHPSAIKVRVSPLGRVIPLEKD